MSDKIKPYSPKFVEPKQFTDEKGRTWEIGQRVRWCWGNRNILCEIDGWISNCDQDDELAKWNTWASLRAIDGSVEPPSFYRGASFKFLVPAEC